jgi:hypothetical protein
MLEEDAKRKYQIKEGLRYSTFSGVNYCKGCASAVCQEDLNKDSHWLNAAEFKCKHRMTRSTFWVIVGLIKDHPVFQGGKRKQVPVEHQLMMLLCFLGTEGNGMSNRRGRSVFRLGKGTITVYKDRAVKAILECLYQDFMKWPDLEE